MGIGQKVSVCVRGLYISFINRKEEKMKVSGGVASQGVAEKLRLKMFASPPPTGPFPGNPPQYWAQTAQRTQA